MQLKHNPHDSVPVLLSTLGSPPWTVDPLLPYWPLWKQDAPATFMPLPKGVSPNEH
jgi:hypothetical protein